MTYEYHEVANIFPMMNAHDRARLEADIQKNGLLEPIALFEGKILDGRNRYEICQAVGEEPRFVDVAPENPVAFVWSYNGCNRNLDKSQLAFSAARAQEWYRKQAKERQREHGGTAPGKKKNTSGPGTGSVPAPESRDEVGKAFGVSGASVGRAAKVLREGSDELIKAIEQGEVKVKTAAAVLDRPKRKQLEAARSRTKKSPRKNGVKRLTVARLKNLIERLDKALKMIDVKFVTHISPGELRHELCGIRSELLELTPCDKGRSKGE